MERKNFKVEYCTWINVILLMVLLLFLFFVSLSAGNYQSLSMGDVFNIVFGNTSNFSSTEINVVRFIRIPRTLSAIIIGGSLAIAGMLFQETFNNDLASPDMLGVSTGACVGACAGILFGFSNINIQLVSFIGGIGTICIVFVLSIIFKKNNRITLILSGILVSGLLTSILSLIKYIADPNSTLPAITYWLMGSVADISYSQLLIIVVPCTICITLSFLLKWRLNFFKINEHAAKSSGVNIKLLKIISILCATILTSCCVSVSGTIGWVGLTIPHLARLLFGNNVKNYFLPTFLFGAIFLLLIDIINRIISTAELPLGILTGIIGIILFIVCVLIRMKKNGINS